MAKKSIEQLIKKGAVEWKPYSDSYYVQPGWLVIVNREELVSTFSRNRNEGWWDANVDGGNGVAHIQMSSKLFDLRKTVA